MQPTWNEYRTAAGQGQTPFNAVDYVVPAHIDEHANPLLDAIETIPVVLVVAADLRLIVAADGNLDRIAVVPGASIYPFCWNLLARRQVTRPRGRVDHISQSLGTRSGHASATA